MKTYINNEEFLKSYDLHTDALFRHCYFRVRKRELAKDLVQEAFMTTWVYLAEGKKIKNIRAFLYSVLNNLIIDESRKQKALSLDGLIEEGFEPVDKKAPDMNQRLIAKEVTQKLDSLEDPYKTVLIMRFIDEFSPKEIAEVLGVTENVVSVRINRGLKKLKEVYERNVI